MLSKSRLLSILFRKCSFRPPLDNRQFKRLFWLAWSVLGVGKWKRFQKSPPAGLQDSLSDATALNEAQSRFPTHLEHALDGPSAN